MEDKDLIKTAVQRSSGFLDLGDMIGLPSGACETLEDLLAEDWVWLAVWEPLLFQSAIDAVNSSDSKIKVRQEEAGVFVYWVETGTNIMLWRFREGSKRATWHGCRKEALKYIYERENIKDFSPTDFLEH